MANISKGSHVLMLHTVVDDAEHRHYIMMTLPTYPGFC